MNLKTSLFIVFISLLGFGALAALVIVLQPEWRIKIHSLLVSDEKVLLASVVGVVGNESDVKVLKFKSPRGIVVEVLVASEEDRGNYILLDRVIIPDRHDGYFHISGQPTQLALVDVDQDGRPEILAPTVDDSLVAHLNALKLNPDTRKLELVRATPQTD